MPVGNNALRNYKSAQFHQIIDIKFAFKWKSENMGLNLLEANG
jgi:hypothetical protein